MKKLIIWTKRVGVLFLLFLVLSVITRIFGGDSVITKFYKEKILFTTYNMVGIIMVVLAPFGIWFGKKGGGKMFSLLSTISLIMSILGIILPLFKSTQAYIDKTKRTVGIILLSIGAIITIFLVIKFIIFIVSKCKSKKLSVQEEKTDKIKDKDNKENLQRIPIMEEKPTETIECQPKTELTFEQKIARDICPKCGGQLVSRQNHNDKRWFKGCSNFPNCKFTISYSQYKNLGGQGAKNG